jgi:AcrR family transcriptional regulator
MVQSKPANAKAQATREKLKDACRRALDRVGYADLKIADVTSEAGVAVGLFYHYFKDLRSLVLELMEELSAGLAEIQEDQADPTPEWLFDRIRAHHLLILRNYQVQPGLTRAFFQIGEDIPGFRDRVMLQYERELLFLIGKARAVFPQRAIADKDALILAYALGGITSHPMRERHTHRDPRITEGSLGAEATAEWLSVLFYRALLGAEPPAAALRFPTVSGALYSAEP